MDRFVITVELYEKYTGQKPVDDDLERSNCQLNGVKRHHTGCGWNYKLNKPVFMVGVESDTKDIPEMGDE
jgi:hypothetical protein